MKEPVTLTLTLDPVTRDAVIALVNERERQVVVEGWTRHNDDNCLGGGLAEAASCYASAAASYARDDLPGALESRKWWPWSPKWWKPFASATTLMPSLIRRHQKACLIKAGALIIAELERLARSQA